MQYINIVHLLVELQLLEMQCTGVKTLDMCLLLSGSEVLGLRVRISPVAYMSCYLVCYGITIYICTLLSSA